ncbi:MAG: hypothetical protein H6742_09905 [Alphaproteobacteria bacterium]|nr:hypothetical protein [Alphaproteobacteria bacterium]
MRSLEHRIADLRGTWRRARARRGGADAATVSPARLVLRLDDGDGGGPLGDADALTPSAWHRFVAAAVDWLGPLPTTVIAIRTGGSELATDLVRFAHRLECDTLLCTDGSGIDDARAGILVDSGLARLRVYMGGVSADVHRTVVGGELADALGAVGSALRARADRRAALDVEVALPWTRPADAEARALAGWAREAGADGFRLVPPWRSADLPSDPELIDQLVDGADRFHRTPAAAVAELHAMAAHADGQPGLARVHAPARRRRMACPVGGLRLELTSHGLLRACPFHAPMSTDFQQATQGRDPLDLASLVAQHAGPHLAAIAACERACAHPELSPRPVLGR